MTMHANALFIGANLDSSYHQAIQLPELKKRALKSANIKLRKAIRASAERAVNLGDAMALATMEYRAAKQAPPTLEIRFLRQGGTVYKTDVDPAYVPPQQSDLDDGVYVKTSFLSKDNPGLASAKFFKLVEEAIRPLCEKEGWEVKEKSTCVRVEICSTMHIDLPLYAIPDDEFGTLAKSLQEATGMSIDMAANDMQSVFTRFRDLRIPEDRVMLAHRKLGWIQSDPRALHDWFEEQFERYGPQLRRQCRYLKGWRDFAFKTGGPSSVALMVCAANVYRAGSISADADRDDLAFLQVSENLPELFAANINNPVLNDAAKLNQWEDDERRMYLEASNDLHDTVDKALNGHYLQELTVTRLQSALGNRVPSRPDLVKAFTKAPTVTAPSKLVAAAPLAKVSRTTSG